MANKDFCDEQDDVGYVKTVSDLKRSFNSLYSYHSEIKKFRKKLTVSRKGEFKMKKSAYFIYCHSCGQPIELLYYKKHNNCYGFCERCGIFFEYNLSELLDEKIVCPACAKKTVVRGHIISFEKGIVMKCAFCANNFIFINDK